MHNELFHIGGYTLYGYGLMVAIGILTAYFMTEYRAKKHGLNSDLIFNLAIWCLLIGYAGSRTLYFITEYKALIEDPSIFLDFTEGYVVYGGIIGGIFGGFLFCKKHKLEFIRYFDLVMPAIALAQGFGRIGCFLAGCCYGEETASWIGVTFPEDSMGPAGVPLIPVQLFSSAFDFLLCVALVITERKKKAHGQVAGMYLVLYGVGRFLIEFIRGDLERGFVGKLSTSQIIAIPMVLIGIAIIVFTGKKYKTDTASNESNNNKALSDNEE